jgi:hypothetical protein
VQRDHLVFTKAPVCPALAALRLPSQTVAARQTRAAQVPAVIAAILPIGVAAWNALNWRLCVVRVSASRGWLARRDLILQLAVTYLRLMCYLRLQIEAE